MYVPAYHSCRHALFDVRLQGFLPIRYLETGGFKFGQIECGVTRPGGHGTGGVGVVLAGGYGFDLVPVAVRQVEHHSGDLVPGDGFARTGHVVRAVRGGIGGLHVTLPVTQQVEDRFGHVRGEREPADLIVHHRHMGELVRWVGDAARQGLHRPDEVVPVADHPRTPEDIVLGAVRDRDVAGGLGLPVHAQRAERLRLVVRLARPVEHVVRADVHERDVMLRADLGEQGGTGRVRPPRRHTTLVGLGPVDGRVRAAIDHRPVQAPVKPVVLRGIRHVERVDIAVIEPRQPQLIRQLVDRAAQLAVAAGHQRAPRRHGQRVLEHWMMFVRLRQLALVQRDRPLDVQLGVGEVHERIRPLQLRAPMRVHQIRVRGAVLQCLEAVAHPARDVDRLRRVQHGRIHLAEAAAGPQIHPRAEHRARRHADVLVPRLRMDAARHAALRIERDVVLHRAEIRQTQRGHLRALPVLLEPAPVVAVHAQIEHQHAGDIRLRDLQILLEIHDAPHCPWAL